VSKGYLRRYCDLTAVVYLLSERKITLLNPASWPDRNDSYYLALYKKRQKLTSVLALCFTEVDERYHYWQVFARGASGLHVRYRRAELLHALRRHPGLRMGKVEYIKLADLRKRPLNIQDLPFVKRHAFGDECEFRIIYESREQSLPKLDIDIPLACVDRIVLSPWLHPDLAKHVKTLLRRIDGCSKVDIRRSTLIGNEEWKRFGERAQIQVKGYMAGRKTLSADK